MASNERVRRVSEQIRRELVSIIPEVVFHQKVTFVSVTGMDLSRDFKFATLYVTFIGDELERIEMVDLLNEKSSSIRHLLSKRLTIRTVPALTFKYDESVEYGARMETLLSDLTKDTDKDL